MGATNSFSEAAWELQTALLRLGLGKSEKILKHITRGKIKLVNGI
jgi:hypothetical protein